MNAIVLPYWVVTAVAHVPAGAYPAYAHGYYERDNAFYLAWDDIARERSAFTRLDGAPRAGHARPRAVPALALLRPRQQRVRVMSARSLHRRMR